MLKLSKLVLVSLVFWVVSFWRFNFMKWFHENCSIERFHSYGQHLCKFDGTKESVCIRQEFNSQRIGLEHQQGCHFIVLEHQYGHCDIVWKHSITCSVNPDHTYLNSDVGTSANSSFVLNKPKLLTISVARTNWSTAVVTFSCKKGIERAMTFKWMKPNLNINWPLYFPHSWNLHRYVIVSCQTAFIAN